MSRPTGDFVSASLMREAFTTFSPDMSVIDPTLPSAVAEIVPDADVNPADYRQRDPGAVVRGVLDHPSLGPGSIIDLHDSSELEDTAQRLTRPLPMIEALPAIIAGLRGRGLTPVGLDEMELVDAVEWHDDRRYP